MAYLTKNPNGDINKEAHPLATAMRLYNNLTPAEKAQNESFVKAALTTQQSNQLGDEVYTNIKNKFPQEGFNPRSQSQYNQLANVKNWVYDNKTNTYYNTAIKAPSGPFVTAGLYGGSLDIGEGAYRLSPKEFEDMIQKPVMNHIDWMDISKQFGSNMMLQDVSDKTAQNVIRGEQYNGQRIMIPGTNLVKKFTQSDFKSGELPILIGMPTKAYWNKLPGQPWISELQEDNHETTDEGYVAKYLVKKGDEKSFGIPSNEKDKLVFDATPLDLDNAGLKGQTAGDYKTVTVIVDGKKIAQEAHISVKREGVKIHVPTKQETENKDKNWIENIASGVSKIF
jgi:hypothetical protein